jgi:hypothetical protein
MGREGLHQHGDADVVRAGLVGGGLRIFRATCRSLTMLCSRFWSRATRVDGAERRFPPRLHGPLGTSSAGDWSPREIAGGWSHGRPSHFHAPPVRFEFNVRSNYLLRKVTLKLLLSF